MKYTLTTFFNSVNLQLSMQEDAIYLCGTARKITKGFPKDFLEDKKMKRGDSDWRVSNTGIIALKWKDNTAVHFLSNLHNPENTESIRRKQKDGTREEFNCSKLVKDYNAHMGYVDKTDMYKSWHRIFWHFVDFTVVKAYIMFKEKATVVGGKPISLKDFRLAVATGLVGADPKTPLRGRRSSGEAVNRFKKQVLLERRLDKAAHMPIHGTKVRCVKCSTRQNPHRTRWHCWSCNVGPCLKDKQNCFADFHKYKNKNKTITAISVFFLHLHK